MANHDEVIKGKSALARVLLQLLTTIAVLGSHMWCKDGIDDDNDYCQHEKDEDEDVSGYGIIETKYLSQAALV